MTFNLSISSLAAVFLCLSSFPATAADTDNNKEKAQVQQTVYGNQLMTREERIEYRNKMRSLKTREEREAFRLEHHKQMQERAKEKGVTLPEAPPARGMGMGTGMGTGMGSGMGPGGPNRPAQ